MKGTENIIARIKADAQSKADAIIAEAEKQCADIRDSYNSKASALYTELTAAGEKAGQELVESKERIIGMESKKDILAMKQQLVAQVFDNAKEKILSLPEEEYVSLLADLVKKSAVTGTEDIVLNAVDAKKVGKALIKKVNADGASFRLSDTNGDFAGGLILKRGNIEANCTVELLVDLCRSEMSADVAKVLFS